MNPARLVAMDVITKPVDSRGFAGRAAGNFAAFDKIRKGFHEDTGD